MPPLQTTGLHTRWENVRLGMRIVLKKIRDRFYSKDSFITWDIPYLPLKKGHVACNPITAQCVISPAFKHFMLDSFKCWNTGLPGHPLHRPAEPSSPNDGAQQQCRTNVMEWGRKSHYKIHPQYYYTKFLVKIKDICQARWVHLPLPWSTEMHNCTSLCLV